MTNSEFNTGLTYLRELADGLMPGQIVTRVNSFPYNLVKTYQWPNAKANLFTNLLISSGYIEFRDGFLFLTEAGFDLVHDEVFPSFTPDLKEFITNEKREPDFYRIWEIIGSKKDDNPLYISGPEYYKAIHPFLTGTPTGYNDYIDNLRKQTLPTSRSKWCKDLFLALDDADVSNFLDSLSAILKSRAEINRHRQRHDNEVVELLLDDSPVWELGKDGAMTPTNDNLVNMNKKKKVFISHNTDDKEYAKALADLLLKMGVSKDDIFCSSYPGLGVKFGDSFIDAIKNQYENYDLIILFIHSPRFYKSPISLCEMGAGWIAKKQHLSFLTNDCDFSELRGVITQTEIAFKAGDEGTYHVLNDFKKMIVDGFQLPSIDDTMWDNMRKDFKSVVETV